MTAVSLVWNTNIVAVSLFWNSNMASYCHVKSSTVHNGVRLRKSICMCVTSLVKIEECKRKKKTVIYFCN